MCSIVFGPARLQSFVICPIINTVVLVVFANSTRISVIYLTCVTLPDVPVQLLECITEIESIITIFEGLFLRVSNIFSILLSARIES
jgi:hypothetical protein